MMNKQKIAMQNFQTNLRLASRATFQEVAKTDNL